MDRASRAKCPPHDAHSVETSTAGALQPVLPMRVFVFLLLIATAAFGRELYPGQYDNVSPTVREWFKNQKSPKDGTLCCSMADGITVEEDIRRGKYWARGGPFSEWTPVPDEVVIKAPNLNGVPVLWWFTQNSRPSIRCYAPGSLS